MLKNQFDLLLTKNASALPTEHGWKLAIPDGNRSTYRVSQVYDYAKFSREAFPHQAAELGLQARVSSPSLPGTWGFGFWNDPFSLAAWPPRLPCLPNACWFFYASPENHLSFHQQQPGSGLLAQVFRSPPIPSIFSVLALPGLPALLWKPASRRLRQLAGTLVRQEGQHLDLDPTEWHAYRLGWGQPGVSFSVDGKIVFQTSLAPVGKLGLIIWIDNQFMAWQPDGTIRAGTLAGPGGWLEIGDVEMKR